MEKLSFEAFNQLCQLNLDKKYVREIVEIITCSDCYFHSGIVMPQDHIASLYKFRLELAKENGKKDENYLNDFERTVSNLQDSKSKVLGITWLNTDSNGSYLIFYEPDHLNILGVLKAISTTNQQSNEKNNSTVVYDEDPTSQKYSKGILVVEKTEPKN